ncbi:MAG TPA: glycosyltransferase [Polyangiaceae bacterium]|nr:glycosyltransferase [Polyangiaceae bacterium]
MRSDAPVLIAQVDPPTLARGGDWYYRTFGPGRGLAAHAGAYVVNCDNVHRRRWEIMREADVLVLNTVCDPDLLPLLRERRSQHKLTVYELSDDVDGLPPWNPVHAYFANPDNLLLFRRLAHSCDAMQCSTAELERLYGYLAPATVVFQNQLLVLPPPRAEPDRDEVVVGWGGSSGHLEDMSALAEPLGQWLASRPDVRLHLMCSDAIWRAFERVPEDRRTRTLPGDIDRYYAFLSDLDVGIAPLRDTAFNRSRSDVKFLEFAAHGVAPVVQHLVPYLDTVQPDRTGWMFRTHEELIQRLTVLADDPASRRRLASAAYDYVSRHRREENHSVERLTFYRRWLERVGHTPRDAESCVATFARLTRGEGVEVAGRHALLQPTSFERLVHDALVLVGLEDRVADARTLLREAVAIEPSDYLPHLVLGSVEGAIEPLDQALRLHASSLQARFALGWEHSKRGDLRRALESFLAAAQAFPEYEMPYVHCARVLHRVGRSEEAAEFERYGAVLAAGLTRPPATAGAA